MMTANFERAFIQCLKDGVYPGPSNINERYRADSKRFNRLNGEKSKSRVALMYLFGVPYQRGPINWDYPHYNYTHPDAGKIPRWPYVNYLDPNYTPPVQGSRKHEIQDPDKPWILKHK